MFKFNFFRYLIFLNTFFVVHTQQVIGLEEGKIPESPQINSTVQNQDQKVEYILDSGDLLYISIKNIPLYSGSYPIDSQGFIDLPELDLVIAKNRTISELEKILLEKYEEFIYNPNVKITLQKPRPVVVTLRGEVNKTGLFTLNSSSAPNNQNAKFSGTSRSSNQYTKVLDRYQTNLKSPIIPPTLFDLISKSDGITSNADLSKVVIIRNNPNTNGGGKVKTVVNLFKLIANGDQSQNIELRDGDDIFVSRSEEILLEQLIAVNTSNLTPNQISVFMNGNVVRKGAITLPSGVSLFEAIAASGEKSLNGNIEFIRLKKKGRTEKRIISFNKKNVKGSPQNPILVNGDIIFVRKNIVGQTTQAISEYSRPLLQGYGLYKIFD